MINQPINQKGILIKKPDIKSYMFLFMNTPYLFMLNYFIKLQQLYLLKDGALSIHSHIIVNSQSNL